MFIKQTIDLIRATFFIIIFIWRIVRWPHSNLPLVSSKHPPFFRRQSFRWRRIRRRVVARVGTGKIASTLLDVAGGWAPVVASVGHVVDVWRWTRTSESSPTSATPRFVGWRAVRVRIFVAVAIFLKITDKKFYSLFCSLQFRETATTPFLLHLNVQD